MADKELTIVFKGEGADSVVAQYNSLILKQKELEKEMAAAGQQTAGAAGQFSELNETLAKYTTAGGLASQVSHGIAAGLGAMGLGLGALALDATTYLLDRFNASAKEGETYLQKFAGQAQDAATALLQVEDAAGKAITRLNEYNRLRAEDDLQKGITAAKDTLKDEASRLTPITLTGTPLATVYRAVRDAANDKNLDASSIDAYIDRLQRAASVSQRMREEAEPARQALLTLKEAFKATTPAIVTETDVTLAHQQALAAQKDATTGSADAQALAKTRQEAFTKAMQDYLKVTDMTVTRATELANARADEAVADKAQELGIKNVAKAEQDAAKAKEDAARAAEKLRKENERLQDQRDREARQLEQINDNYAAYVQHLEDVDWAKSQAVVKADREYMAHFQTEIDLLRLSNRERAIQVALIEREKILGPSSMTPAVVEQTTKAAGDLFDAKEQAAAAKKAADEVEQVWDRARRGIQDSWSDLWYGVFNDGKFKFKDFADSLKSIWARTLADMIALSTQQSIVAPIFEGLFGMTPQQAGLQGSGGGTGAAGTRDAFSVLTGGVWHYDTTKYGAPGSTAWMNEYVYGPSGAGTEAIPLSGLNKLLSTKIGGTSLGGLLGGAGLGMGLGGLTGSGTAGALGGALGSFLGPIGSVVGGLLGGLIGGLFKSTPRSISSVTTNGGGLAGLGDSYASGLDISIGQKAAKSVASTLNSFADELGLSLDSDAFVGMVGQRGKKFFYQATQGDIKKAGKKSQGAVQFDDAESAIAAAVEAALKNGIIDGLSDADKRLLDAASDVQQGMQDVIAAHDFRKELNFQYIGLSDPLAEQLARLKDWYDEQLKLADKYEADKTQLEAVYAAKRSDLIKQYNEQLYGGLKDFLTAITAGSASPLSPTTKLTLAQSRYADLSDRAKKGDKDAIAALQGAAQDYLSAAQGVYASAPGYQSVYQQVVADVSKITGVSNPLALTAQAAANVNIAAVNDNTKALVSAASQAAQQRAATNAKLDSIIQQNATIQTALQRLAASGVLQNGTIKI